MTTRVSHQLTLARRMLLASAAIAALAGPMIVGMLSAPRASAQSAAPAVDDKLAFEVASIKPADPEARGVIIGPAPGGGMRFSNVSLKQMIAFAYDVRDFQITGGPSWAGSARFDVLGKPDRADFPENPREVSQEVRDLFIAQNRARVRNLLRERFQLAIVRESKELPVYALIQTRSGHKMKKSQLDASQRQHMMRMGGGQMRSEAITMPMLGNALANIVGKPVLDRTGLEGTFDFELEWTPDPGMMPGPGGGRPTQATAPDLSGPSIFTALQEQLGLKLDSQRGEVEMLRIDRVERPSEN